MRDSVSSLDARVEEQLRRDGIGLPDDRAVHASSSPAAVANNALPEEGMLTLSDLLAAAQANDPALAASTSELGMAIAQSWQASLYPNPRVEIGTEEVPFDGGFDDGKTVVGFTQPIVMGKRLDHAIEAAEAETDVKRARLELRRRELFGQVAALYAELIAIRSAEELYIELGALGDKTLETAKARFEARAAPESEVIRPQIELFQLKRSQSRLTAEKTAALNQLALLTGGKPIDVARLSDESWIGAPPDFEQCASQMKSNHPALLIADREIDAAGARLNQVKSERVPDLDVHAGIGYSGEAEDGIYELGAGIMLPLWDNSQGNVLAARFDLMRARQQRSAIERDLSQQLIETYGEFESASAQMEIVRDDVLPAAQRSFEQAQEAYRGGRSAFIDLLDAQRTLTETRITLIEITSELQAARARLLQIIGPNAAPAAVSAPNEFTTSINNFDVEID